MSPICPKCFEETSIKVNIEDGDTLECPNCEEEFSLSNVIDMIESWKGLLPWLKSHPARQPECVKVVA